ncbi:hypothetical protein GCM10009558_085780 [Virgisporangium aurantiacum]
MHAEIASGFAAAGFRKAAGAGTWPAYPNTNPTRILCAAVHADDGWCGFVNWWFRRSAYRAMTPSYRTDMATVAAHSHASRHRQAVRDAVLAAVLITTVFVLVRRHGVWPVLAPTAVVAAGAVAGGITTRKGAGWSGLWHRLRQRYRANPVQMAQEATLFAFVVVLGTWFALSEPAVVSALPVLGFGALAAFVVATVDAGIARAWARIVRDSQRPLRDLAPSPPRWLADRLEPLACPEDVNFFVYHGSHRFNHTLVGNGEFVHDWQISVDIGQGKLKKPGTFDEPGTFEEREKPKLVDIRELHEALRASAARAGIPGLWYGYRTYADGRFRLDDGARPDDRPCEPPATRVSRADRLDSLGRADAQQRTYLCMQIANWNGDLMVTLFVRAEVIAGILYLYSKVYVLPGIEEPTLVRELPRHLPEALGLAMVTGCRRFIPLVLWSPLRSLAFLADPVRRWAKREYERYMIRRGSHFDFGGRWSLREHFVFGQELEFNARDDLMRDLYVLESRLAKALKDHLDKLDIDTSAIEKTVMAIIVAQQMTFNAKNIKIGGDGRAGDTVHNFVEPSSTSAASANTAASAAGGVDE